MSLSPWTKVLCPLLISRLLLSEWPMCCSVRLAKLLTFFGDYTWVDVYFDEVHNCYIRKVCLSSLKNKPFNALSSYLSCISISQFHPNNALFIWIWSEFLPFFTSYVVGFFLTQMACKTYQTVRYYHVLINYQHIIPESVLIDCSQYDSHVSMQCNLFHHLLHQSLQIRNIFMI